MWFFRNKKRDIDSNQVKQLTALQNQVAYLQTAITFQQGIQFINDSIALYPTMDTQAQINQYITSDHVYSVVNKIAETTSLIPFYTYYKVPDAKKSLRHYETITTRQFYSSKGLFDIRIMQHKALEEAPETDPMEMLLDNPNPHQSKQDFFLALYTYYLLAGEAFIYKVRLNAAANIGKITELYLLSPESIIILVTKQYPYTVTGYQYKVNAQTVLLLKPEDIIHIKKFNPSCDVLGTALRGLSPLKSACKVLTRLVEADSRSIAQLQNGGTPGIIFDEGIQQNEVDQANLDDARKHLYKFLNEPDNTGAPYLSAGKKGYIQLGLKLADLELIELQKIDFKRLCNIYKVSDILFNSDTAATESNVKEMITQMYTNACLPLAYIVRDKLNKGLATEFKDNKQRYLDCDISGITELQDNMLETANALAAMPITPSGNEMLALFNFGERDDIPEMDMPLVKQGYSFVTDLSVEPIDPNLANDLYGQQG